MHPDFHAQSSHTCYELQHMQQPMLWRHCLKCAKPSSITWHAGASPADDIGRRISDNGTEAYEIR